MTKRFIAAIALAASSLAPVPAAAQAKPTDIYVSVVNGKGDPVTGLTAADFTVREDNVAREVLEARPATEPLTVALLVDDSQALNQDVSMFRDGLRNFIRALSGKGEIALITFGERPVISVDYTTDTKKLEDAANRIFPRPGSGAYLMDAIVEVSRGLQKREAKRPVIVVLMLEDVEFSTRYYQQVLDEIDKSRATLNVVALGQPEPNTQDEIRNRNMVVAEGTARTGGRRDQVLAATGIPGKMKQLAEELINQYVVTYARPEALIPPEKVSVSVSRPGVTVRARTRTGVVGAR
jgi:VWFA-related protein